MHSVGMHGVGVSSKGASSVGVYCVGMNLVSVHGVDVPNMGVHKTWLFFSGNNVNIWCPLKKLRYFFPITVQSAS